MGLNLEKQALAVGDRMRRTNGVLVESLEDRAAGDLLRDPWVRCKVFGERSTGERFEAEEKLDVSTFAMVEAPPAEEPPPAGNEADDVPPAQSGGGRRRARG